MRKKCMGMIKGRQRDHPAEQRVVTVDLITRAGFTFRVPGLYHIPDCSGPTFRVFQTP